QIGDRGQLFVTLAARGRRKLARVAVGIARTDVARLDHVVADAGVIVTDRLALDGKARHGPRRPERSGDRNVEPDLHSAFFHKVEASARMKHAIIPSWGRGE